MYGKTGLLCSQTSALEGRIAYPEQQTPVENSKLGPGKPGVE